MLRGGASDDEMRKFREKHRREACKQFEDQAKEIKEKMRREAERVTGTAQPNGQCNQQKNSDGERPRYKIKSIKHCASTPPQE